MPPTDVSPAALGERIAAARNRARLTQQQLADRSGVSKVWISKMERGLIGRPGLLNLRQVERVLGSGIVPEQGNVEVPQQPAYGSKRLPVYLWGAAGKPGDAVSGPYPDHEEYPPVGKESLIGPNGFAVMVKGESMRSFGIGDGDLVWVNPDRPYSPRRPVLVRAWTPDGIECGMYIKILNVDDAGRWIVWDVQSDAPLENSGRFEVIGPIVGISPAFRVPQPIR